jgi:hypothetical protein
MMNQSGSHTRSTDYGETSMDEEEFDSLNSDVDGIATIAHFDRKSNQRLAASRTVPVY